MIPVRNIYYMLSYAFQVLNEQGYKDVSTETFDNVAELCAAILSKGISVQLKRGLQKEYVPKTDALVALKGKIDISESLKTGTLFKKKLVCGFDEFSENNYLNKILKTTATFLIRSDISKARKKELKRLMAYFSEVEVLDIHAINWNLQYNRNDQTYRMLISVCYLVLKGLLQTTSEGKTRLMDFLDEQRMCHLYEKFILEYFRQEHPEIKASASQIPWQLDDGVMTMLPVMQSDTMLEQGKKVLIIDAKYYTHTTQTQFDVHTLHSNNLYQIFTYVKNKEVELSDSPHEVSGMLLYARTDEEIQPDASFRMSGNRISVKTLDLNCDFSNIRQQLDAIASEYFGD